MADDEIEIATKLNFNLNNEKSSHPRAAIAIQNDSPSNLFAPNKWDYHLVDNPYYNYHEFLTAFSARIMAPLMDK